MLNEDHVTAELMRPGSLAGFLGRWALLDTDGGDSYEYQILQFPTWTAGHPDEAAAFKALLAEQILDPSITPAALEAITGGVTGDASMADVEGSLRNTWFDLFGNDPIPGDRHPLPEWWRRWAGSTLLSENNNGNPDTAFTDQKLEWLTHRGLTEADRRNSWELIRALNVRWGGPVNFYRCTGYLRHLRARWEAGDHTAVPTLPPRPEDVDGWEDYLDWWPGPSRS